MPSAAPCALLLLCAGASSRWGRPKALLPWPPPVALPVGENSSAIAPAPALAGPAPTTSAATTLADHLAAVALASGAAPVVRVLGALATEIAARAPAPAGVHDIINLDWRAGMGASIACGLRHALALAPALAALLVLPCDQPLVTPALLAELRARVLATPEALLACDYENGAHGPPAAFGRAYFDELLALRGDEGGRQILRRHAERRGLIPFADGRWDLDSAADLAAFHARHLPPSPAPVPA